MCEERTIKKYIYKIVNKVNNKCYVGQSKDYNKRFQEHRWALKNNKHENACLQNAWNKYGEENFDFVVIEDLTSDYNSLEKYWIKELNSVTPNGYNILKGGEEPPLLKGNNSYRKKISEKQAKEIQELLLKNVDVQDIHKQYPQITIGQINRINNGEAWRNSTLHYPLQDRMVVGHDIALKIQDDLLRGKETQKAIAKKYNVCRSFVTGINNGVYAEYRTLEDYPIRKSSMREISEDIFYKIFEELKNSEKTQLKIAEEYQVSLDIVRAINLGKQKLCKNIDFIYPIRKNTHKL